MFWGKHDVWYSNLLCRSMMSYSISPVASIVVFEFPTLWIMDLIRCTSTEMTRESDYSCIYDVSNTRNSAKFVHNPSLSTVSSTTPCFSLNSMVEMLPTFLTPRKVTMLLQIAFANNAVSEGAIFRVMESAAT